MNDCPEGTQKFIRNDHLPEVTDEREVVVEDANMDDVAVTDESEVVVEDANMDDVTVTDNPVDIDDSGLDVNADIADDEDVACYEPLSGGTIESIKNLEIEKDYTDKEPLCHSEDVVSQRQGSTNTALSRKLGRKRRIMDDPSLLDDLDSGTHKVV